MTIVTYDHRNAIVQHKNTKKKTLVQSNIVVSDLKVSGRAVYGIAFALLCFFLSRTRSLSTLDRAADPTQPSLFLSYPHPHWAQSRG